MVTSDESTPTSDISFSDGETAEETTSKPETSTEPTKPKNDTSKKTTSKQVSSNKQDTTSKSDNQTQTTPKTTDKPTTSEKPTSSEEKPKSAFAKPFDTGTMKSELISYGKSIGMTHVTHMPEEWGGGLITIDGTSWLPPHETWMYDSSSAGKLKQDLCDRIKRWKNEGADVFTLIFEKDSKHSGDYIIYVVIT